MTNFPNSQLPLLGSAVKNNIVTANEQLAYLDWMAAGGKLVSSTTTPPTGVNSEAHLISGTPSGVWSTDGAAAGQIAFYFNGWLYVTPTTGQRYYDVPSAEHRGYDSTYGWFPLQERWSTTEHWTGKFRGTPGPLTRVFSKMLHVSGLPNNNTKNTAHGISNLDLASGVVVQSAVGKSSESFAIPARAPAVASMCAVRVDATNMITDTTSAYNASTFDGDFRLEFLKTA